MPKPQTKPRIQAWSFSRWSTYENCPRQAKLAYLDKVPEHPRQLPAGQAEAPNDRGTRIHELSEHVIQTPQAKIPNELRHFSPEYSLLQTLHTNDRVVVEEDWLFDKDWTSLSPNADRKDIWLRVKIDILVWMNSHYLVVIDGKTGKRRFNEIKHAEQTNLYQLATLLRFPEVQRADTELWYFDLPELIHSPCSRSFGLRSFTKWDKRAKTITQDTEFKPSPSTDHCKFCPYRTGSNKWVTGTGDCNLNPPDKTEDNDETYRAKLNATVA